MTLPLSNAMAKALSALRSSKPDAAAKIIQEALSLTTRGKQEGLHQPSAMPASQPARAVLPVPITAHGKQKPRPFVSTGRPFMSGNYACSAGARDYLLHLPPEPKPRSLLDN